jgi:hypothetical protein
MLPAVREHRLEKLVVEALENMNPDQGDLRRLPRTKCRDFLQVTVDTVIFEGSQVTVRLRPDSDRPFPTLQT